MFIKRLTVGLLQTNCYILADEETKLAAVIDPGGGANKILKIIKENDYKVKYIINTHKHTDHTWDNKKIKEKTSASLLIHKDDAELSIIRRILRGVKPERLLTDGDKIKLGNLTLKILHTPGHTPGSICINVNNVLFSGDTIFASSIGRTDFINGSMDKLLHSIKTKILPLPDETIIYPGHGPATTLKKEKQNNPFIANE